MHIGCNMFVAGGEVRVVFVRVRPISSITAFDTRYVATIYSECCSR